MWDGIKKEEQKEGKNTRGERTEGDWKNASGGTDPSLPPAEMGTETSGRRNGGVGMGIIYVFE